MYGIMSLREQMLIPLYALSGGQAIQPNRLQSGVRVAVLPSPVPAFGNEPPPSCLHDHYEPP